MNIKTLPVGQLETNCYVVINEDTLECVVIDPGDESNTTMWIIVLICAAALAVVLVVLSRKKRNS